MLSLIFALALLPNQAAALPAPVITELTNLSLPKLQAEYPQGEIHYEYGLAGYFPAPQYWRAPIWTTPAVQHLDIDHLLFWLWVREHRDDCPPSEVPEPGAIALIAAGLMAVALR